MPKEKPPTGSRKTLNSSSGYRNSRSLSREPPADRRQFTPDRERRTPSPIESEGTLQSESPLSEYNSASHTSQGTDSGVGSMAKVSETDKLAKILASVLEKTEIDRVRDEQRRVEREQEQMRREERRARETRDLIEQAEQNRARDEERRDRETKEMIQAIREAQPAVPQTVYIENTKLPNMSEGEDIEVFLDLFEVAMTDNNIPEAKWRGKMHASLDTETKLKVRDLIRDPAVTYQELKDSLIGCGALTFSNASETLMNADRGKILSLPLRQAIHKWHRLLEKMSCEATTISEMCMYIAVAIARYNANPDLKKYQDTKGDFSKDIFCCTADEWQANQPSGTKWSKRGEHTSSPYERPDSKPVRKPGTCFHCGKMGHYSRECRTRLTEDRSSQPPRTPVVKTEPTTPTNPVSSTERQISMPRWEIMCFYCQKNGHKSPQCPLRQVKCVQVATKQPITLKDNELMGSIGAHVLPVTCDSGTDITIVPEECVKDVGFTGDTCELASFNREISSGRTCNIVVTVGGRKFQRKAVAQPGRDLGWTTCLSLPTFTCYKFDVTFSLPDTIL